MEEAQWLLNALAASDTHMISGTFHWLELIMEPHLTARILEVDSSCEIMTSRKLDICKH